METIKKPFYKRWWVILIAIWLAGMTTYRMFHPVESPTIKDGGTAPVLAVSDTSEKPKPIPNPSIKLKEEIESYISEIDHNPFKDIDWKSSSAGALTACSYFSDWSSVIKDGQASSDQEVKNATSILTQKAIDFQIQFLPKLRKSYSDAYAKELWSQDIYVTSSGPKNTILNMTGGLFAANKNKQESINLINADVQSLGFTEVRYRWYKDEDEYTQYKIDPVKKDSDLR